MNESNTTLAMDLSEGLFAYHLFGVMKACFEAGSLCPDAEAEALDYLNTYHKGWDEVDEGIHSEPFDRDGWDDEEALSSAGMGMDESYTDGGAYREDFGYFGEMGMMED